MVLSLLFIFVLSVALCAALTRYLRDFAVARGWVDPPDATRHLHDRPVPRLGGVAVFAAVAAIAAVSLLARPLLHLPAILSFRATLAVLAPATLIFLVGLYDDFRSLGPYAKFGAQIVAACLLYFGGLGIHRFDLLLRGATLEVLVGLPLTIVWVLLITNAFNLIDGLDGLAAGAALFSTIVVFVLSVVARQAFVSFLAAALAGAIVGFLRFNFHPATIFLGDSGSQFIGFLLSALALAGSQKAPTMVAVAIPVVCFGLPILDVAMAVLRRFLNGKPLFEGDHEHIHHRLLNRGVSQRHAVLILYGVCALFGLLSIGLLHGGETTAAALVILGVGVCVGVPQLRYREFQEMRRVLLRTAAQRHIIENNLHVRRAADALRACRDASELCGILVTALRPSGFDGFRLLVPAKRKLAVPLPDLVERGLRGEWKCSWFAPRAASPRWELRLELVDEQGERCGALTVFRCLTAKPLLMDINLLSDGFQSALAGAVKRTILEFRPAAPQPERQLPANAAKAVSA